MMWNIFFVKEPAYDDVVVLTCKRYCITNSESRVIRDYVCHVGGWIAVRFEI